MRARVFVKLKKGILDVQGTAVKRALEGLGFAEVKDLRVGKVLDLELETEDPAQTRARLEEMCRKLLANPVMEDFTVEILETGAKTLLP